jgi:hypothetical protein
MSFFGDISNLIGGAGSSAMMPGLGTIVGGASALGGLGLEAFGMISAQQSEEQAAQASENITGIQIQENNLRQQMMEVQSRRQQMQVLRNAQSQRAQAQTVATGQGAQFGSGIQGAMGNVQGAGVTSLVGINQNLQAGEQMFGYENQISQQQFALAQAQGSLATAQGYSAMGGALMGSVTPLTKLFGG